MTPVPHPFPRVIGTAGHIDHGKTALVRALTGVDTDRLPEEKQRGITIDIGFAHYSDHVTIIDVPGHEKLVKNMVAGVSSIDLVLLVIAADDGVMPQTREHLDIIRLLDIRNGVVAITKSDLADPEWLDLVEEDVRGLIATTPLKDAPVLRTSATTGLGVDALRETLDTRLNALPPRADHAIFRLPVDRAFSVKGFGTVVTGTVLGGSLAIGDEVTILPSGEPARVRGLHRRDQAVDAVTIGDRAAINLTGIDTEAVPRGTVLAAPGRYRPVERINTRLTLLDAVSAPLKTNQRVRLHLHTGEVMARVVIPETPQLQPGESAFVQFRLEEPVHAAYRDRFIIRRLSPAMTIGGGTVLQAGALRYRKKFATLFQDTAAALFEGDDRSRLLAAFDPVTAAPVSMRELVVATNLDEATLQREVKTLLREGRLSTLTIGGEKRYLSQAQLETVVVRLEQVLDRYHRRYPGRLGMTEVELSGMLARRYAADVVQRALNAGRQQERLTMERERYRLAAFTPTLSGRDSEQYQELLAWYESARFQPPTAKEVQERFSLDQKGFRELTRMMVEEGHIVHTEGGLFFHRVAVDAAVDVLREVFAETAELGVPAFKDLIGSSRKHAIPLLTHLDRSGFTERDGDVRRAGTRLNG